MAVVEQPVVANAMEAGWQDVEQEAAHELAHVEAHDFVLVMSVLAIVLPAETDMGRVEIKQAAVGDCRDAVIPFLLFLVPRGYCHGYVFRSANATDYVFRSATIAVAFPNLNI